MERYDKKAKKKVVDSISTIARRKKPFPARESNRKASDPIRVAMLCPYSMSVPGGVQNQVLLISNGLRENGIDARIIAPCDGVPPTTYTISVGSTRSLKSNGSLAPIADDSQSSSRTLDALSSFNPDVIHLHEPLVPGPTTAAMIGADFKMIGTFHAAGEGVQALKYFRHPARGAVSRIHKRIAVSNAARDLAGQYLPGDYEIVPNCVDVDAIKSAKAWPKSKPTVFFVGRHEERKGLRYLIQAWVESNFLQDNCQLWVAGTGEETSELVAMTSAIDSVSFLGRVDNDELYRRMKAADVVVAPALYGESFGIVLLEAMAASASVVGSDIPGYRDVARNNKEALLVPPGDALAIAQAIEKLVSNPDLAKRLKSAGSKRVEEFSVSKIVRMYEDLYRDLSKR